MVSANPGPVRPEIKSEDVPALSEVHRQISDHLGAASRRQFSVSVSLTTLMLLAGAYVVKERQALKGDGLALATTGTLFVVALHLFTTTYLWDKWHDYYRSQRLHKILRALLLASSETAWRTIHSPATVSHLTHDPNPALTVEDMKDAGTSFATGTLSFVRAQGVAAAFTVAVLWWMAIGCWFAGLVVAIAATGLALYHGQILRNRAAAQGESHRETDRCITEASDASTATDKGHD